MPWNGLHTWLAGEMPTADDFNDYINDNLAYLLNPNSFYVFENTGTYSTTSTSLTNVGTSTNKTLITNGGPILIAGRCILYSGSAVAAYLALNLDGTQVEIARTESNGNSYIGRTPFFHIWTPAAGSHAIALQWRVASGTLTMTNTYEPLTFMGIEL